MTVGEFVAAINSKCENVTAELDDRGLIIRRKDGNAAVRLFFRVAHIGFIPVYGVMRGSTGRIRYIGEKGRSKVIERLKKAIGCQEDTNDK